MVVRLLRFESSLKEGGLVVQGAISVNTDFFNVIESDTSAVVSSRKPLSPFVIVPGKVPPHPNYTVTNVLASVTR